MLDTLARYILKRTTLRFLLLFAVFMGVLVGGQVALLLGRGVPPEACLPMIQAMSLLSVPIALPVSLATAILVVLGGMVQDGEFRALAASGVSHRRVLVRLVPLILGAMLLCGLLTHVVMPMGIADMRANKGKLLQTAIASRVAEGEPMVDHKGMSVWVGSADGPRLQDVRALLKRGDEQIALYAPEAQWVLADQGVHLECRNVQMMVRHPGKHLMTMDTERYAYLFDSELAKREKINPDALSTTEVLALTRALPKPDESHAVYNNARLTLHFRFFLPLSLIAFGLLAMGLGLAFGTDQNLPGVIIIVVIVAAVVYPTFGYVKNNTSKPQIDPSFILYPPAVLVALIGGWLAWRPERARETLAKPLLWLASRRAGRA
ncbi:MAG: LptF/LptG family permease [Planctomycetes bacterium]|nr:LptF/LptG family permease [Planctomycetota bacterium]